MEHLELTSQRSEFIGKTYRRYYNELLAFFLSYSHDTMTAEDMLQTLFIKIMSVDVLNEETVRSLLYSTARHIIIDDARHKAHVRRAQEYFTCFGDVKSNPTIYDKLDTDLILDIEEKVVSALPKKRARIYRMWRSDTMSMKNIAEDMNLSVRTVEHQVYLASKTVKAFICKAM